MGRSMKFTALAFALFALSARQTAAASLLVDFEPPQASLGQTTPFSVSGGGETVNFANGIISSSATPAPFTVVSQGTNGDVVLGAAPGAGLSGQFLEGVASAVVVPILGSVAHEELVLTFSNPVASLTANYYINSGAGTTIGFNPGAGTSTTANTFTYVPIGGPGNDGSTFTIQVTNFTGANAVLAIDNLQVTYVPEIDPSSAAGALTLMGSAVVMIRGRRKAARA
jgi:hypothetical protein